jgi:hypothetical protein
MPVFLWLNLQRICVDRARKEDKARIANMIFFQKNNSDCWTTYPKNSYPGWPDRVNFRLLGNCFLWTVLWRIFPRKMSCTNFDKKWVWCHFGRFFFKNSSGHPARIRVWAGTLSNFRASITIRDEVFFLFLSTRVRWKKFHGKRWVRKRGMTRYSA